MMNEILSQREKEVLHLIAYENTSEEIAKKLFISRHTARSHRKNLLSKLSVKNMAGLVRRGFELGLISVESVEGETQELSKITIPKLDFSIANKKPKVVRAATQSIHIKSIRPSLKKAALA
jgi:DNA-binding CsgD family transcriptional regulator